MPIEITCSAPRGTSGILGGPLLSRRATTAAIFDITPTPSDVGQWLLRRNRLRSQQSVPCPLRVDAKLGTAEARVGSDSRDTLNRYFTHGTPARSLDDPRVEAPVRDYVILNNQIVHHSGVVDDHV